MPKDCSIIVEKLVIVGTRKNYIVSFNPGVNIIYGDITTGKSSILNLIDYLLGGKNFNLYPEIEATARYAVLDVYLNDVRYSIKRDIYDAKKMVEVYQCGFEEIDRHVPSKYLPSYQNDILTKENGFYSDFLLDSLNLEKIRIKNSPSKTDSGLSRLSFRDIFKYCYVDQDDLGSKGFLDRGNYVLEAKHTEVFKFIFNALDTQISDINAEISEKSNRKHKLEKKYEYISEFLRDTDFDSKENIESLLETTEENIFFLTKKIHETKYRYTANNDVYKAIKEAANELNYEVSKTEQSISDSRQKIENFTRLKNEYILDINKFKSIQETRNGIGEKKEEVSLCPICSNILPVEIAKESFEISDYENISHEISSLRRRLHEVDRIIVQSRQEWELQSIKLNKLKSSRDEARAALDKNTVDMVSPYLAETDTLISKLASLEQQKKELVFLIKIRNQQSSIYNDIIKLIDNIKSLNERLDKLKAETPSISNIIEKMSDYLNSYLRKINIKDRYAVGIRADKFFLYIRDIDYQKLTSGGLRTIASIGYLCSFMRASLDVDMNYPTFLMIDTVGKYLGKTKDNDKYKTETSLEDDKKEGVSDPEKYKNIYEYMIDLSGKFEEKGRLCQFILVDNDVPPHIIKEYAGFVVAHFSSDGQNNLPVGLIDDADLYRTS